MKCRKHQTQTEKKKSQYGDIGRERGGPEKVQSQSEGKKKKKLIGSNLVVARKYWGNPNPGVGRDPKHPS